MSTEKYRGFMNLTESLKEMHLNDTTGVPQATCGASNLQGVSFRNLMSDVMSLKKSDWNETLADLVGYDKLCSMDTTENFDEDNKEVKANKSADEGSYHDFYLI